MVHVQTPSWQSIATVAPLVSAAVHPHAPFPAVHVGFSQTLVRSGVAGAAGDAGAVDGAAAGVTAAPVTGCCAEASGERGAEVSAPPLFAFALFAADAPELRRSDSESVSPEQAARRNIERNAGAMY